MAIKLTLPPETPEKLEKLAQFKEKGTVSRTDVSSPPPGPLGGPDKTKEMSPQEKIDREGSWKRFQEAKDWLENVAPKAVNFKNPVPLKVNIHKDVKALESSISYRQRIKVLRGYLYSPGYLKAILNGEWRHDLEGQPVEPISLHQKSYAKEQLQYRRAIWEKRKKERQGQNPQKGQGTPYETGKEP